MYFDAVSTMAVVDELNEKLVGGRVQDTVQIAPHVYGMEVYANRDRHYLLLSAHQQTARVHLVDEKLRRGVQQPSQLALLLRRYVEGSRIDEIHQPDWERMIILTFDGPEGMFELIAEPIDRRANLLLVGEDGIVMDCTRRVGPEDNRVRVSLPGQPYEPPPPQKSKRDPYQLTLTLLGDMLDNDPGQKTRQILTRRLLGFSPQLAKEAVFRATGQVNALAADTSTRTLLDVVQDLFEQFRDGRWEPGVAIDDDGVQAFSVYRLTYLEGWEPMKGASSAMQRYYGIAEGEGAYDAAKRPVEAVLREASIRVEKKLESLRESLQGEQALEHLRQSGELLLAYQYGIQPGQTELKAQYEVEGPELTITLDPSLSPLENAQRYFERYEKAKRARAEVPALIAAAEQELDYLNQLKTDLMLASNWPEISEVQESLQENGYWRGKRSRQPGGGRSAPLRVIDDDGWVIWIGRNSRQNDMVTFGKGSSDDLWLHVRGMPGAHVIIKSDGRPVPESVINFAASLAAYYSRARTENRVLVDVTQRKYVRKIKGGKPGMVTYRNEQPVEVAPAAEPPA